MSWEPRCKTSYFCVKSFSELSELWLQFFLCSFTSKNSSHTHSHIHLWITCILPSSVDQEMPDLYNREKVWRHIVLSLNTYAHRESTQCLLFTETLHTNIQRYNSVWVHSLDEKYVWKRYHSWKSNYQMHSLFKTRINIVGFLTKWWTVRSEISMSFRATIQIKDKAPLPRTVEKS